MPLHRPAALACLVLLGGCQSAPVENPSQAGGPPAQEWSPSTLSPDTIAKADAAVRDYRQCLNRETLARSGERGNPLELANRILKACEDSLPAIKTAYDAENVPAAISERYIRKTRSQGAQSVLRAVQAVQAQRAGEEEAQSAAKQKKSKHPQ